MWIIDPRTKKTSVTLTIAVISFSLACLAGLLEVLGLSHTTSIFAELFYASMATYLGRRFNYKGQFLGAEPNKEDKSDEQS